jgi:hypothetical protein
MWEMEDLAKTKSVSAQRHEQTNDMTRRSPLLKPQPPRLFAAQVTLQGLPSTCKGADTSARESGKSTAALKYPRVSYTDLDNLICKKSEEEVRSEAEGEEHS